MRGKQGFIVGFGGAEGVSVETTSLLGSAVRLFSKKIIIVIFYFVEHLTNTLTAVSSC